MTNSTLARRGFLTGAVGLAALLGTSACGSSSTTSTASSDTATSTATATGSASASAGSSAAASGDVPTLESLTAEVKSQFKQYTYSDSTTGKTLPYNLFVPADYSKSTAVPLLLYIADSSLVGKEVTAPLSQYGALIWASSGDQAKHKSIVLVPEYPETIVDGTTANEYVDMTVRLMESVRSQYTIDPARIYGTGQSMGCMTVMYLAAKQPDLFTAELFVSGQWDVSQLANLAKATFFYIAAGGDDRASGGQADVQKMLTTAGVKYGTATWDATWSSTQLADAAAKLFADGYSINFASFKTGTVLTASGGSSAQMGAEHMASFEPAYKITALRDWLFEQKR